MIDLLHPAHVHFFHHFIKEMESKGHEILVTAREKDVTLALLKDFAIRHICLSKRKNGFFGLLSEWIVRNIKFYGVARKFKPNVLLGIMGPTIGPMSVVLRKPAVVFWDTENTKLINRIVFRLAAAVVTPMSFKKKVNGRHIKYRGFHELAYLHPQRFTPNPAVLKQLGVKKGEKFILVRFVSWQAIHDIGITGIQDKVGFVKGLEKYGRVFITSEGKLPKELEPYHITLRPSAMHDVLHYATLYIGEGATMASEAALLGTPSVYVNKEALGYIEELEQYNLVHVVPEEKPALQRAQELLQDAQLKRKWQTRRKRLLDEKIDVTTMMMDITERFAK